MTELYNNLQLCKIAGVNNLKTFLWGLFVHITWSTKSKINQWFDDKIQSFVKNLQILVILLV